MLTAGCHRQGGQEPYSPVIDALAAHLHAQPPARLTTMIEGCAWLVRLLPELAAHLEPLPVGGFRPEQERRLLFAAVARVLSNAAGNAGMLLILDDLQWAGLDALDLLATLVRNPALRCASWAAIATRRSGRMIPSVCSWAKRRRRDWSGSRRLAP